MSSRTLYVIGNGFDLWHGIPSSLAQFKAFIRSTDRGVFREVEDYLPMRDDWCDLEMALAKLDADVLIDNLGHFMGSYGADDWSDSGHHDFQYEVGKVVERLSTDLRQRFAEWVRELPIPTRATAQKLLSTLDNKATFLTFNYTETLEKIYGVRPERLLFIHGCAAMPDDELVLGHSWHPDDRPSLNDHPDIGEMDTRLMEVHSIIDDYFSKTFKRSDELIDRHSSFFDGLSEINRVVVLGHSLSTVDAGYFQALLKQRSVREARWQIACRDESDWPEKLSCLTQLGISPAQASHVLWSDL